MPYICPDSIPTEKTYITLEVPDSRLFVGAVLGAITELTYAYNWEAEQGYSNTTPEECAKAAEDIIGSSAVSDCKCFQGIGYNTSNGQWFYMSDGGQISNFVNQQIVNNSMQTFINPTPMIDGKDVYCYAAQNIARTTADDFQDFLELIDISEAFIIEPLVIAFNEYADIVPLIGDTAAAALSILNNLSEEILDYARVNATDADAVNGLAEIIYCALLSISNGSGDFSGLRGTLISQAGSDLVQFTTNFTNGQVEASDFFAVLNVAYSTLSSENMKYPLLAWLLLFDKSTQMLGQPSSIQRAISFAQEYAISSDGRDCSTYSCNYDWEARTGGSYGVGGFVGLRTTWNSTTEQWEFTNPGASQSAGVEKTFGTDTTITYIWLSYTVEQTGNRAAGFYVGSNTLLQWTHDGNETNTREWSGSYSDGGRMVLALNNAIVGEQIIIHGAIVRGTGTNPFT